MSPHHVPMLVPGGESCKSLVSQITFYESDDDDLSQMSSTSFKCNNKWNAEKELCHFRIALDQNNNVPTTAERTSSSASSNKPISMPVRKCSTNRLILFDLISPVTGETKYEPLKNSLLSTRRSKQESTLSPIPQEPRGKARLLSPIPQEATKANAKWDFAAAEKSTRSRSTVGTLLSILASPSAAAAGGSPSGNDGEKRLSFTRISMSGALIQGNMQLKKPIRRVSNNLEGSPEFPSLRKTHLHSVGSPRRARLSTMPLTMPIRKPSTQDLPSSGGSTNALRKKLSRSKLHNQSGGGGAYNPMMMIPRRVGSASSMTRNPSRDLLWRYG